MQQIVAFFQEIGCDGRNLARSPIGFEFPIVFKLRSVCPDTSDGQVENPGDLTNGEPFTKTVLKNLEEFW